MCLCTSPTSRATATSRSLMVRPSNSTSPPARRVKKRRTFALSEIVQRTHASRRPMPAARCVTRERCLLGADAGVSRFGYRHAEKGEAVLVHAGVGDLHVDRMNRAYMLVAVVGV